jgi:hypothetical protein
MSQNKWTRQDIQHILLAVFITLFFTVRKGPVNEVIIIMAKHLWAYSIYSIATVLIIVGLTKKVFKYEASFPQMVRWAAYFAAFCAVTQFFHEAFQAFVQAGK